MLTATLGGLIKDYRIKKRLSQVDISLKLGWKDTSRISKIEQGRVGKPNRQTVERIINALELTEQEKGHFLLVGGFLPADKEIQEIIKEVKQRVDTWQYPAYLMDFSFRWLYPNEQILRAACLPSEQKDWIVTNKPNLLMFPFVPWEMLPVEVMKGEDEAGLTPFSIAMISDFKNENGKYQNESWYKKLIKDLMQFEDFRKMWPKVTVDMYKKKLFDYEYKKMTGTHDGKKISLRFHLTVSKLISDQRFHLVFYFPADKTTETFFQTTTTNSNK